ncbi:MAG: pilus assembly protein [Candidatus Angelobacter sp.]|nr:pilus assembly protein [Candidatus Angelobacter sp.]
MIFKSIRFWALLGLLLSSTAMLHAAVCSLSLTPLSFGPVDVIAGTVRDSSSSVTVTCIGLPGEVVSYSLAASLSPTYSGTRTLTSGTSALQYNLFVTSARTVVFGDATHGTSLIGGGMTIGLVSTQSVQTIFGRIPGNQNLAPPGSYSDTVVVTVSY